LRNEQNSRASVDVFRGKRGGGEIRSAPRGAEKGYNSWWELCHANLRPVGTWGGGRGFWQQEQKFTARVFLGGGHAKMKKRRKYQVLGKSIFVPKKRSAFYHSAGNLFRNKRVWGVGREDCDGEPWGRGLNISAGEPRKADFGQKRGGGGQDKRVG